VKRRIDPHQIEIEWNCPKASAAPMAEEVPSDADAVPTPLPATLVQRLQWDFRNTFPQPTQEALDTCVLSDEDAEPENVRAIHEEHVREALFVLHSLDAVLDARRLGVDPTTGKTPSTHAGRERLRKLLETEPGRLQQWEQTLMGTYEEVFGPEAADAFGKAIRAWHAGIEVIAESGPGDLQSRETREAKPMERKAGASQRSRVSSRLPVPKPLRSSIAANIFGHDENGKPIRPAADEVREISESHAEKMIDMNEQCLRAAVTKYAEDFGPHAAEQLERYVRRQKRSR
jgi:hypothetical protein